MNRILGYNKPLFGPSVMFCILCFCLVFSFAMLCHFFSSVFLLPCHQLHSLHLCSLSSAALTHQSPSTVFSLPVFFVLIVSSSQSLMLFHGRFSSRQSMVFFVSPCSCFCKYFSLFFLNVLLCLV